MTAAGQLPPTVLQPRAQGEELPNRVRGCSAAEPPQSIVGEIHTEWQIESRAFVDVVVQPALGTPAGHENTVSTTGSTSSQSGTGIGFHSRQLHNKKAGQSGSTGCGNQVRFGPVAWPADRTVAGSW